MTRQHESGYALVAVLLTVAIMMALTTLGLRQIKEASRSSGLDGPVMQADYLASSGIGRARELMQDTGATPIPSRYHDEKNCPPDQAPGAPVFYPDAAYPETQNQRVWIFGAREVCNPTVALATQSWPREDSLPAGNYHFRFTWVDADGNETMPSSASVVKTTATDHAPAYSVPIARLPAASARIYVARTDQPAPPPLAGDYHAIDDTTDSELCDTATGLWCLTKLPSASPSPPTENQTASFLVIRAKGWIGDEAAPTAMRQLSGRATGTAGHVVVRFDYAW